MNDLTAFTDMNPNQQAIIEAASRLIVEKGVKQTSLADIAREVGISKGTLYYYYASKKDLVFDVTEHHFDRITQDLLAWIASVTGESDPKEIFKVVFETIVGAKARGRLHIYLLQSITEGDAALRERFHQKYAEWRAMIKTGLALIQGRPQVEFEALSVLILAALDGLVIQAYLGIETGQADGIIDWLVARL